MKRVTATPIALTVAGSDSGGGAGIQADLKTFHSLGVFGTCAITAITCQNPQRVSAVQAVAPKMITGQIDRVFEAFPVGAAKTGMLYDAKIIRLVAAAFRSRRFKSLVVDPVMVATGGTLLLKKDALKTLQTTLLPLALVVTPNVVEAELLLHRRIQSVAELRAAAEELAERYETAFLVKGGHLPGAKQSVDVLFDGRQIHEFSAAFIPGIRTHGTGCTFSAAIAAHLARGDGLVEAAGRGKVFVTRAIRNALHIGKYRALAT